MARWTLITFLLLLSCTPTQSPVQLEPTTLNDYYASVNISCMEDYDCVIKDVRNCCGYYPRCVNKDAQVDANFVKKSCEKEGIASVCGVPSLEACTCRDKKCVGTNI